MENKYYPINETTARQAKEMNSFYDYKPGSATAEYKSEVDEAFELAERKAEKYPEETEEIQRLLNRYSERLACWYNKYFSIECRYPSVMVAGPSNFPVRKKEKQNAARESHSEELKKIEYLLEKIRKIGTGPIKSNDEKVIEKLESKLETLKASQETMKTVNAFYRKNKTLDGCPSISAETVAQLTAVMHRSWRAEPKPFEAYSLQNNNACIKATADRLKRLQAEKAKSPATAETSSVPSPFENPFCKVVENAEIMRIQLIFEGKPDENTRNILKSNGFKWAPSQTAWQRQLTENGRYATKQVLKQLAV